MRRRKPQPVCKCKHAKSKHNFFNLNFSMEFCCSYCYDKCPKFQMDNLKTLEKLSEFAEQKSS